EGIVKTVGNAVTKPGGRLREGANAQDVCPWALEGCGRAAVGELARLKTASAGAAIAQAGQAWIQSTADAGVASAGRRAKPPGHLAPWDQIRDVAAQAAFAVSVRFTPGADASGRRRVAARI